MHAARLRVELSQSKREQHEYLKNVELARVLDKRAERKRKAGQEGPSTPEQSKKAKKDGSAEVDSKLKKEKSKEKNISNEDNEKQDRSAFGNEVEDLDEEDPELEEFNAFEPAEQLDKLVAYLRKRWYYCFWCKHQYADDKMEGCPGLTEDDHD